MKGKVIAIVLACGTMILSNSLAFDKPALAPLPNFDRRVESGNQPKPRKDLKLFQQLPSAQVDWDGTTGSPIWVRSAMGHLTGPGGTGRVTSSAIVDAFAADEPHRATKAFLKEHRELFGHDDEALRKARIKSQSVTEHNGLQTVIWEQEVDGIGVFDGLLVSHTTRDGELVSVSSQFIAAPEQAAEKGRRNKSHRRGEPIVSVMQAVVAAAAQAGEGVEIAELKPDKPSEYPAQTQTLHGGKALRGRTHAKLVWLPVNADEMRLCWEIILTSGARGEMFQVLVDGETGEPWLRRCLTEYISDVTYRVYTTESPSPFGPGHSTPSTVQPPIVSRQLVTLPALDTNASPNGWINDGSNQTFGNNVDAGLDRNGDEENDTRVQGSPARVFDFPLDLSSQPANYVNAAVVQLFYWCNWIHDQFYRLGFTEAAGNFQVDNFGRGGVANDPVEAEAHDPEGLSNANFSTPPDGHSGRMQMYLWADPFPDRDGDLDAHIIVHEYAHGLSNRRVGGGRGISATQSRGMGEGWSDFLALALLTNPSADPDAVYPLGGYTCYLLGHTENYYYGIRRYPYCTDTNKNPLTFKDIDPGQISAHPGVPRNPRNPFSTNEAAIVHRQGEVWCTTLWEIRANLIRKHGGTNGNRLAMQLVVDGMRLSPPNPTFLQARDAIIAADRVNNRGANLRELWAAFAKRGMGLSATCPPSFTTRGVREAFDAPGEIWVSPVQDWISRGRSGGPFAPQERWLTLDNLGTNSIPWTATASVPWLNLSTNGGMLTKSWPRALVAVSINDTAALLPRGNHTGEVVVVEQFSGRAYTNRVTLQIDAIDFLVEDFWNSRDNDLDYTTLTFTPDDSPSGYSVCRGSATWFSANPYGGFSFSGVVNLPPGKTVALFGRQWTSIYPHRDGYITFGQNDSFTPSVLEGHFDAPRVTALSGGFTTGPNSATWKFLADRFVATYDGVDQYPGTNNNTFQIELFYNGVIRLTYLRVDTRTGIVGLSRGDGIPPGFTETDFSSLLYCPEPLNLQIPSTVTEGGPLLAQISRPASQSTDLAVGLSSSAPDELTVPPMVTIPAGATSAVFTVTVEDDTQADGTKPCYIKAVAQGFTDTTALVLVEDNEYRTLTLDLPPSVSEGETFVGAVSASEAVAGGVFVTLRTANSSLELPGFVFIPAGATSTSFTALALDDAIMRGPVEASIFAEVPNWSNAQALTIVMDNDPAQLILDVPAQTTEAAVDRFANMGRVRIPGSVPHAVVVRLSSSEPSILGVPAQVTIPAGQTSAAFTLTLADDAVAAGSRSVQVRAEADAWAADNRNVVVLDDETPAEPSVPAPTNFAIGQATNLTLSWNGGVGELIANGGFERGDFRGWRKTAFSDDPDGGGIWTHFVINDGTYDPRLDHFSRVGIAGLTAPFAGSFSALGISQLCNGGIATLSQDITLPINVSSLVLSWVDRVFNMESVYSPEQSFQVEVRDTNDAIREILFRTEATFPSSNAWTLRSFPLTRYAGERVRLVWRQEYACDPLNTFLDNISLQASVGLPTTYDIYVGTTSDLDSSHIRGTSAEPAFAISGLGPGATYFWKVVARRGSASTSGPVWQFRTQDEQRFTWGNIATQQVVGHPFTASVSARASTGEIESGYTNGISIQSSAVLPGRPMFADDFEDGNFGGWSVPGPPGAVLVFTGIAASGERSLTINGGTRVHGGGPSVSLPRGLVRPNRINFALRVSATNVMGGFLYIASGSVFSGNDGIFCYSAASGRLGVRHHVQGFIGTPIERARWYRCSIVFDWARRQYHFLVDDVAVARDLSFPSTMLFNSVASIQIYNFDATQTWWDDIEILEGGQIVPVAFTPTRTAAFTEGSWTGPITFLEPAADVWLTADDGLGRVRASTHFAVLPGADSDDDGLPDAWEQIYFGSPALATAHADADLDGLSNSGEFRAGTHPRQAGSTLRIRTVRVTAERVAVSFDSVAGKSYRLEGAESVSDGWRSVAGPLIGTGGVMQAIAMEHNATNHFYRLSLAP